MWVQERTRWNSLEKHDFEEKKREKQSETEENRGKEMKEFVSVEFVVKRRRQIGYVVGMSEGYKGRERLMWAIGWGDKWTDEIES